MANPAEAARRYRADPAKRARAQKVNAARSAALTDLAILHPEEYLRLCNEHRTRLGLPPLKSRGRPKVRLLAKLPEVPS